MFPIFSLKQRILSRSFLMILLFGILTMTLACRSNQAQSKKSVSDQVDYNKQQEGETAGFLTPSRINPDDCNLVIKVIEVTDQVTKGTILELRQRGLGFKDYMNNGDTIRFKRLGDKSALRAGTIISGTISSGRSFTDVVYTLRNGTIMKQ